MARSPSTEFDPEHRSRLLALARTALAHGCGGEPLTDNHPQLASALDDPHFSEVRNCFVTLMRNEALRGCIGSLSASRPLASDVATNAYNAGFRDPRFPAISARDLDDIDIQISVLSPQQPLAAASEMHLLDALVPHVDGLTLEDGTYRATFLPKVWEQLSDPRQFVGELKRKAGLSIGHWSPTIRFWRYHAENFAESEKRLSAW